MLSVKFEKVKKSFGGTVAVRGVDLEVVEGELFFLLGPSGCGKTTCLRMAAGFERPDTGSILFGGRDVTETPPARRNAGMVFQSYALFPHMTVERNVAFGLRFRKLDASEKAARVAEAMKHTRIDEFSRRFPAQLSGGQQQRVALARALVIRPDVLLLDEPLSNLDAALRAEMRSEIRRIHDELKITTLYVTHDQEEALSMADRIALMRDGEIVQLGPPREIYFNPRNSFVASFVGKTNLLRGQVVETQPGMARVETVAGVVSASGGNLAAAAVSSEAVVSLRPECVHIAEEQPPAAVCALPSKVESAAFLGGIVRLELRTETGGLQITADVAAADVSAPVPGKRVFAYFMSEDLVVLED